MKKSFLVLLSVLLVFSFVLGGCGSKAPKSAVEGTTWIISGGKDGTGIEITSDQLGLVGIGDFSLEFKADGVVTASVAGETSDGTWSEKDNAVTVEIDGDTIAGTVDGDKLTLEQEDMTLYFDKQK